MLTNIREGGFRQNAQSETSALSWFTWPCLVRQNHVWPRSTNNYFLVADADIQYKPDYVHMLTYALYTAHFTRQNLSEGIFSTRMIVYASIKLSRCNRALFKCTEYKINWTKKWNCPRIVKHCSIPCPTFPTLLRWFPWNRQRVAPCELNRARNQTTTEHTHAVATKNSELPVTGQAVFVFILQSTPRNRDW